MADTKLVSMTNQDAVDIDGADLVYLVADVATTAVDRKATITNLATAIGTVGGFLTADVAVADGGTGASDAATARTNLGVAIGSDVQAYDAGLADLAGLAVTDGNFIVGDGVNWVVESGATARTSLGVDAAGTDNSTDVTLAGTGTYISIVGQVITVDPITESDITDLGTYQTSDATLTSIAALGTAADKYAYTTGVDTWAEGAITAFARTILDDANVATARTTLGVDAAGTDNSTDVTLAGTPDYITLVGQVITRNQIDVTTDITGIVPIANLATGTPDGSKFIRDDGTLQTPAGGGDVSDGDTLSTGLTFPAAGLHLLDTNGSHDLIISAGSDLTADHTLTITTGDADRTLDISGGSVTISAFGATVIDDANAAAARTTLGVDAAGTDNSTDVTLAGTGTYISIVGQVITVDPITESDITDLGTYLTAASIDTLAELNAIVGDATLIDQTGSTSLVTVGTITTGTWTGTAIAAAYIGTHASTHQSGGGDAIKLDDLSAPDDTTDLDVSTTLHGLVPKAPNDTGQVLLGDGTWGAVVGGAVDSITINVRNVSGSTITKGTPVYESGWNGGTGRVEIAPADASAAATMPAIGLVSADIANNANGQVIAFGDLVNLDTSAFTDGDPLYVSETTGTLTATKPTGTALIQKVGSVLFANISAGDIFVSGANRSNDIPNIADTNFWVGNGSGAATAVAMSGGATMANTGAVTIVTNANLTGPITSTGNATAVAAQTGTGTTFVMQASPTLTTPDIGTPSAGVLTNCTGLPVGGLANGTDGELITWDAAGVATTVAVGTATHVLTSNGVGVAPTFQAPAAGSGDVVGPASAVDNSVALFDTTTGKLISDSPLTYASSTLTSSDASLTVEANSGTSGDLQITSTQAVLRSPDGTDGVTSKDGEVVLTTNNTTRVSVSDSGLELGNANARVTTIIDDDTMATATATVICTGESIKAYADTKLADVIDDTTPELGGELDAGAHTIGFTAGTATGDGTTTIDWKLGNKFNFTFGAFNETFTFTAPTNPCNIVLKLVQDATGSRTATWPATVKWPAGTAPTLTTAASSVDVIAFYFDGTNYYGSAMLDCK